MNLKIKWKLQSTNRCLEPFRNKERNFMNNSSVKSIKQQLILIQNLNQPEINLWLDQHTNSSQREHKRFDWLDESILISLLIQRCSSILILFLLIKRMMIHINAYLTFEKLTTQLSSQIKELKLNLQNPCDH